MKKETGIAIFLGIVFGLGLSLFMIFKTKDTQMGKSKPLTSEKRITPVAMKVDTQSMTFKVNEPMDKFITLSKTVTIKGEGEKDALLVVQSPIKDMAVKLEKTDYKIDFPLALGENVINLSLYPVDSQGRVLQKELRVYYLDEQ
jgi:hypothetical protein